MYMNSFYKFNILDLRETILKLNSTDLSCQENWKENFEKKLNKLIKETDIDLLEGEIKRRKFYLEKLNFLSEKRSKDEKFDKLQNSKLLIHHDSFDSNKELVKEYLQQLDYFRLYFRKEKNYMEFKYLFMLYSNYLNTIYKFI